MFDHPLSLPLRLSVTASMLLFVLQASRALGRAARPPDAAARLLLGYWPVAFAVGALFSHVPALRGALPWAFPVGAAIGALVAALSLALPSARASFDAVGDADVRALLSYRTLFGAFIFALAALGHFPESFAMTAGLGDLAVGWLAAASPESLAPGARSPRERGLRLLVHGVGLVDLLAVVFMALTAVRPWSVAHGNAATSMTLPWVFVPFMFALNLHGIRQAVAASAGPGAKAAEPLGDGPEPARGLRSAAP
jgi:hypothetical protein